LGGAVPEGLKLSGFGLNRRILPKEASAMRRDFGTWSA
jgi:hypothetical protein